jgi:hypothetical protein
VLAISVVLLAVVIVAVVALATDLLGLSTTYGNGVNSSLGAQVAHDFLADQEGEATALSNGEQSVLGGHLTDSALSDVIQQISSQSSSVSPPAVSFHPASLKILRAVDPADSSLVIEVQEDGTKSVVTSGGADSAPTEQTIGFHGDFWLRNPSGSRYTIADQDIQTLPNSPLPATATVVVALLFVGLATVLVHRQRAVRPAPPIAPELQADARPIAPELQTGGPAVGIDEPPAIELAEPLRPPPQIVVATFGGLRLRAGDQDWAQALMSRPVTGFVWLRLLVAAIRNPVSQVGRDEVARQASPPGLTRDVQLKRLRNVVAKGLPKMPAVLRDRIVVMPESMSFRLEDCEVDAIELIAVSAGANAGRDFSPTEAARIQRLLSACQGVFLPEFESLEIFATDRHPSCTELINELRESLTNKRVDLALRMAEIHLRAGRPTQAIAVLEPAISDRREREDLADRLAAAYRGAGREAEAKALEARHV